MRTRSEIKEHAKQMFGLQRGTIIATVFLAMLVTFVYAAMSWIPTVMSWLSLITGTAIIVIPAFVTFSALFSFLAIPIMLFTFVLMTNLDGTAVKMYHGHPVVATEPYANLKYNFGRKLGGNCWVLLWSYLWTLVGMFSLFIPTLIKMLSYSMATYILACHPNVNAIEALNLSKRMTKGHKGKVFMMGLSFIGWMILSALTLNILGIFYVYPYMRIAFAGLFTELRNEAIASGAIHPAELDGVTAYYPQHGQQQYYAQTSQQYGQEQQQYQQQPYGQAPAQNTQYPQQQYQPQQYGQEQQQYYAQTPQQYGQAQYPQQQQPQQPYGQAPVQNTQYPQPLVAQPPQYPQQPAQGYQPNQPAPENNDQNQDPPQPPIRL